MLLQNVMTSEVLHNHLEATYITVDSVRFFGVKQKPSLVLVNDQGVPFTYRENRVSRGILYSKVVTSCSGFQTLNWREDEKKVFMKK